jgi:hypothetical protein
VWKITKNIIDGNNNHKTSYDYKEGTNLPYRFIMRDADKELYFEGVTDNASSFAPLDDYGMPGYGCTDIKYLN